MIFCGGDPTSHKRGYKQDDKSYGKNEVIRIGREATKCGTQKQKGGGEEKGDGCAEERIFEKSFKGAIRRCARVGMALGFDMIVLRFHGDSPYGLIVYIYEPCRENMIGRTS